VLPTGACFAGAQAYVAAVAATGRDPVPQYGQSFEQLDVTVTPETASRLRVKVAPTGVPRWEVPEMIVARFVAAAVALPPVLPCTSTTTLLIFSLTDFDYILSTVFFTLHAHHAVLPQAWPRAWSS
jgi:N-terminal barrel of NtMGAM and CtMGAM, maltase-glucoamylase